MAFLGYWKTLRYRNDWTLTNELPRRNLAPYFKWKLQEMISPEKFVISCYDNAGNLLAT